MPLEQSKHREPGKVLYVTGEGNKLRQIKGDLSSLTGLTPFCLEADSAAGADGNDYPLHWACCPDSIMSPYSLSSLD